MKIGFTIDQTPGGPTFKRKNDRMNEINFSASWLSDVERFLFQAAPQYPKKKERKNSMKRNRKLESSSSGPGRKLDAPLSPTSKKKNSVSHFSFNLKKMSDFDLSKKSRNLGCLASVPSVMDLG